MKNKRYLVFINDIAPLLKNEVGILPIQKINDKNCLVCTHFAIVHPFVTLTISPSLETNQLGSDISVTVPFQHIDYVVAVEPDSAYKIPGFHMKSSDDK